MMVIGVIGHQVKGRVKFSAVAVARSVTKMKVNNIYKTISVCVFELRVLFRWKQDGEEKTEGSDF